MIKNVLLDVDGVLLYGDKKIFGADKTISFLEKNNYNFLLLTNASRYTAKELAEILSEQGIKVNASRIVGPVESTIGFIQSKNKNAKCFVLGSDQVKSDFRKAGLKVVEKEEKTDFVAVFLFKAIDYKSLDIAFRLILNGAEVVASSLSKSFPEKNGQLAIGTGPFVKALEFASGKTTRIIGKPSKDFFEQALSKLGAKPQETIMVGDSLDADILGAKNTGITAVLVKTGNFNQAELEKSVIKPDYVIESIADLQRLLESKK